MDPCQYKVLNKYQNKVLVSRLVDSKWQNSATNTDTVQELANKNIERHTTHTIVSWANPKQWNESYFRFEIDDK